MALGDGGSQNSGFSAARGTLGVVTYPRGVFGLVGVYLDCHVGGSSPVCGREKGMHGVGRGKVTSSLGIVLLGYTGCYLGLTVCGSR